MNDIEKLVHIIDAGRFDDHAVKMLHSQCNELCPEPSAVAVRVTASCYHFKAAVLPFQLLKHHHIYVYSAEVVFKNGDILTAVDEVPGVFQQKGCLPGAENARNYSQCDSLLLGDKCGAHTFPDMIIMNPTATVEHEATTSKINEDQLFYCQQRGIGLEDAVGLIVNGYAKEVMDKLPMEFAVEAQKLLQVSLEGSVG